MRPTRAPEFGISKGQVSNKISIYKYFRLPITNTASNFDPHSIWAINVKFEPKMVKIVFPRKIKPDVDIGISWIAVYEYLIRLLIWPSFGSRKPHFEARMNKIHSAWKLNKMRCYRGFCWVGITHKILD